MDRISYISSFSKGITLKDVEVIGKISVANNAKDNLTGALICFNGVFHQILEGAPGPLYQCFERIKADPRHQDIFIMDIQRNIPTRLYSEWKMKTVILDENTDPLMTPIRNLLTSLTNTHSTLKKYAPIEVLNGIQQGQNPLDWDMERLEMIVLFSDLIGFTTLMEKAAIYKVKQVLEQYFEVSLAAISDAGGTISKLMGDGFLAYFPINHAAAALNASIGIMKSLHQLRNNATSPYEQLTYASIGLSAGPVLKGNIGSSIKTDYTVLGDVVNSASRIEGYTREVGYSVLFDHRFRSYLPKMFDLDITKIGSLIPKGKSQTLNIYTIDDPIIPFEKSPQEIVESLRSI